MIMNKKKWDSITPDLQNIIEQVDADWIIKHGNHWDQIDKEGRDFSLSRGNKVISLSAAENARWAKAAEPLFDEYVKNMKAKNLPGDQVLKFARDYLKAASKK
jgi:TRAP-type C4-dicarboxylate transport system substrate-binding protein